ncbi:MAG: AmmeMemoRadiSam system radical SAM enzyme [Omnitrophica WOR_2 bacterium GWF2_38_59]|nr:MAG: AmmeMemoRadiSam system radical SAM enzyme [Omnitrophica WOR_2 bacterium GWA2_37_7]OGX23030.1 MAG: AmmeMemoRadiSam system radical SAM enzyme [Omnitrophica WOR_2 bacterium GWF2_38_59]OGX51226.1 MAG: AmmeMemoRadiSam system radical SAM enzyme [Omnitrophica WOR_2 bacterium RIFOXYA2_FULL_38_17]OGX54805.1 MAG: AmmeMemoRadiSam system radical SAM enzyme [Omnitrophica WOR_2 bacterium RIFOXYA12_FULL_38_10]OGX55347.1 MAG: AmmeMemoRadiSam system radical SAM enzyme [Omnitrophica WOR_2 bacterium RIFOX
MNSNNKSKLARFWEQIEKDTIKCTLCPRHCILKNGRSGFCFVRQNLSGKMVLITYGRSSGFCIDPIEKKPLNHFYPGSKILSFGTAGCNLGCKFCQNWDLSRSREFDRMTEKASPAEIALAAKTHDCKSVAFTYNDPIIFAEYASDTAIECHKLDIKTVAVTAGYITDEARPYFFEHIDAANVDLKSFSDDFYEKYCSGQIEPVLKTLVYLKERTDVWFEITNLIIPGLNDTDQEIKNMTKWIFTNLGKNVPLHFSAFHPIYKMTDRKATPEETLIKARDIALDSGLQHVYTGNIHHKESSSTYCSNCKNLLIERDWYTIGEYNLVNNNHCPNCSTVCAGIF